MTVNRREFTKALGCMVGLAAMPFKASSNPTKNFTLTAAPSYNPLFVRDNSSVLTDLWTFNGSSPGPVLRFKEGVRAKIDLYNRLPQETSIHWHGIRLKNEMDGVVGITQPGVKYGERFSYDFDLPDAGTYWYHSHNKAWEQVARGLYGPLIVDGPNDPSVDHDVVLMIDDWQLNKEGQIREKTFGSLHDWAHAGRMGNWVTVNSKSNPSYPLKLNSRLRLRLINAANARVFELNFAGVTPMIIALDGNPINPSRSANITLGPGQRADFIVDIHTNIVKFRLEVPTRSEPVIVAEFLTDTSLGEAGGLIDREIVTPQRRKPPQEDINSLNIPVHMQGGAMGNLRSAILKGKMTPLRELAQKHQKVWAFNGIIGGYDHKLATLKRGQLAILDVHNDTRWPHAMHLHGHHFWITSKLNPVDDPLSKRDTYLMQPGERAKLTFIADNPGLWLFHCHMLEHHAAGMGAVLEVL